MRVTTTPNYDHLVNDHSDGTLVLRPTSRSIRLHRSLQLKTLVIQRAPMLVVRACRDSVRSRLDLRYGPRVDANGHSIYAETLIIESV